MIKHKPLTSVAERIHAAIKPQLNKIDYMLWELQTPRTSEGRHAK